MTIAQAETTGTTHAPRRRRLARLLAAGALAAGAVVSLAAPAHAAVTSASPVAAPGVHAPGTATLVATRGATINYNEGYGGSCVYYAMNRFHRFTGVYPKAFGDAKYLARSAAANGWTVGSMPRVNSLAVFQPGQNGAGAPTGHVAWVERVSGGRILIAEMNAPEPWVVSHRWLRPAGGVRYVYAP